MTSFLEENLEDVKKLEANYPNNMEFGNNLRKLYRDDKFIISIPNDEALGREVRNLIKNQK
jgi:hypothetical protein